MNIEDNNARVIFARLRDRVFDVLNKYKAELSISPAVLYYLQNTGYEVMSLAMIQRIGQVCVLYAHSVNETTFPTADTLIKVFSVTDDEIKNSMHAFEALRPKVHLEMQTAMLHDLWRLIEIICLEPLSSSRTDNIP